MLPWQLTEINQYFNKVLLYIIIFELTLILFQQDIFMVLVNYNNNILTIHSIFVMHFHGHSVFYTA